MPNAANKNAGPHHQCRQQAAGDGRALDQRCGLHGSLAHQLQSDAPADQEEHAHPSAAVIQGAKPGDEIWSAGIYHRFGFAAERFLGFDCG